MAIREKGGKFLADFMVDGTRYREVFGSRPEAEAWELKCRAALKLGQPVPRKEFNPAVAAGGLRTMRGLMEHVCKVHWKDAKSAADQLRNAKRFVDFVGGNIPPASAFTVENLGAFVEMLKTSGCSNGTVNRYLSNVSKMASVALKADRITKMPEIPWQKEGPGRTIAFTRDEVEAIIKLATRWGYQREADMFQFLIDTGCRLGELTKVRWGDFNADLTAVTFARDITKTSHDRTIPLFPTTTEVMKRCRLVTGDLERPFQDTSPARLRKVWYRIKEKLKLPDETTIHTLRHTRCTWFALEGWDFWRIQKWMGHSSLATTRRYTNLVPNDLDAMVHGRDDSHLSPDQR
ncbi:MULTISPECIES: site-specific integrase [unclassified Xanthobacter]|uniref:tyrosine-type recombinase/integrase n=2 Tax=Xanthobacter TaxID=279 RepID=UPI001F161F14|nr:site-specific integrase [Xanthobacter aminoxidans]